MALRMWESRWIARNPWTAARPRGRRGSLLVSSSTLRGNGCRRSITGALTGQPVRAALPIPQARIQEIPKRVAEHVEGEHDNADGETGENGEVWRRLEVAPTFAAQHTAPRRGRRGRAETQKAQRGLDDDRVAEPHGRDHENRREDVRQDVAQDDSPGRGPRRMRGIDEGLLLDGEHGAP